MRIEAISAEPLPIPLLEPFAISRATTTSTRAVLVRARCSAAEATVTGYGEAALPLGSSEQPHALLAAIDAVAGALVGKQLSGPDELTAVLDADFGGSRTARSGLHCALLDALARLAGVPLYALLGGANPAPLLTDITLPIAQPRHLAGLAERYWERGFRCFKLKVGARLEHDQQTVRAVAQATPEAVLLFDANGGFEASAALALLSFSEQLEMSVTCFEQPCAPADVEGMRRVRRDTTVPVVADEAVVDEADLERLCAAEAIDGVNLKLVKMGGIDRCLRLGRLAQKRGLRLMVGAMIESRLGLTAMAHVVAALGGVQWVDLDTAFLLAHDPFDGGMVADGPKLTLPADPGLGLLPQGLVPAAGVADG